MSPQSAKFPHYDDHKPPRVLVVDDDELFHGSIRPMLEQAGCKVETATDSSRALILVQSMHIDMVLMDLRMPHMDGVTTVRLLRALGNSTSKLPVIMTSAHCSPDSVDELQESGACGFTPKPIRFPTLVKLLQEHLSYTPGMSPGRQDDAKTSHEIPLILRQKFIIHVQSLLVDVEAAIQASTMDLAPLQESAHKMAGIAALLGQPELGELASQVDLGIAQTGAPHNSDLLCLRAALLTVLKT